MIDSAIRHHNLLKDLYPIIFAYARDFVSTNRDFRELRLFDEMFSLYPRFCSVNYYKEGIPAGIISHRDSLSFCTVGLYIYGNSDIILKLEDNSEYRVALDIGGSVVFGRIDQSFDAWG